MANLCKFDKKQYQVSYDSGVTWENVIPEQIDRGDNMIEYDSQDCSSVDTMYRWRTLDGQYLCDDKEKWTKEIREESYNNGLTWYTSYPTVYRKGTYVGIDNEFCNDKFVGHYVYDPSNCSSGGGRTCPTRFFWNGYVCLPIWVYEWASIDPLKVVKCNDNDTLTNGDVGYYGNQCGYLLSSAEIGDCVKNIDTRAFARCTSISSITIPNSVISIGTEAFRWCDNLTSVTIGSGMTTIGTGAFMSCTNLSSINIPSNLTTIGESAFSGCTGLSSITIPNSVTTIGNYAFYGCSSLTNINIPSGLTSIGYGVFNGCTSMKGDIDIPNSVTTIREGAFRYCSGLTSVTIGSGITSIGDSAFRYCSGLTSITINALIPPRFDASYVLPFNDTNNCPIYVPCESVGIYKNRWMDIYADRIQGIPPCTTPTGTTKFSATYNDGRTYSAACDGDSYLTTATTEPSGYETSAMTNAIIGDCVTSINNGTFDGYSRGYSSLTSVIISDSVTSIGQEAFDSCYNLTRCVIGSGLRSIDRYAFRNCSGLTSINIPSGVTFIGESAFEGIRGNTYLDLPNIVNIGSGAFYNCKDLRSASLGNKLTSIDSAAFRECRSLTSVTIGSGVTSIGIYAFYGCSGLTSITCLATTPPSLESYSHVFDRTNDCPIYVPCDSLPLYKIAWFDYASRIQGISPCESPTPTGATKVYASYNNGDIYYKYCDSSTELTNGETQPSQYVTSAMTSVEIGSCVTTIGDNAFQDCTSLSSVTIPNSVTSIGTRAFYNCTGLTSIDIPSGVTSIGYAAFNGCDSLTSVTIHATTPPSLSTSFGTNDKLVIYVPCESVETYKYIWIDNAWKIQGIPPCGTPTPTGATKFLATYTNGNTNYKYCDSSTELTSGEIKTSGYTTSAMTSVIIGDCVTSIGDEAFASCTSLTAITIPNSVTSIGDGAFGNCSGLTSVELPNSVTSIGEIAFGNCYGLITVNIPNSVTSIGVQTFRWCRSLTSITIPDSVTSIAMYAFWYCSSLTSITIPNNVSSIGISAFDSCSGLTSITCLATTPPTLGTRAFDNTNNCPIYVPSASVEAYKSRWSTNASRIQPIT